MLAKLGAKHWLMEKRKHDTEFAEERRAPLKTVHKEDNIFIWEAPREAHCNDCHSQAKHVQASKNYKSLTLILLMSKKMILP